MDQLTLFLHGFTIIPDPEWAMRALDMSTDVVLSHCSCRKALAPDLPLEWKCLGLGVATTVTRDTSAQPFRDITKERAKELVAKKCDDCLECLKVCHFKALAESKGRVVQDQAKCHGCETLP